MTADLTARPARFERGPAHPAIDEALIRTVVHSFYERVRADAALAPVFERRIAPAEWPAHLQKMTDFWSSVLIMSGRYKGRPMPVHQRIAEAHPEHFERWLALFRETARETCPPGAAEIFIERAERIAASLQLGMFYDPAAKARSSETKQGGPA